MTRLDTLEARALEPVAEEVAAKVCPCRVTAPNTEHDRDRSVECAHTQNIVLATLKALAARGVRPPEPPKPKDVEYRIVGSWLVEVVDDCTCGTGGVVTAPHEPGCGSDPIVDLAKLRDWPSGPEPVIRGDALDDAAEALVATSLEDRWRFVDWLRAQARLERAKLRA